jgi:hypothetical protein
MSEHEVSGDGLDGSITLRPPTGKLSVIYCLDGSITLKALRDLLRAVIGSLCSDVGVRISPPVKSGSGPKELL